MIRIEGLHKTFTLHTQGGVTLEVLNGFDLRITAGECVVLAGPSGTGKSTLLRCLYGNYRSVSGRTLVRHDGAWLDLATASPREVLAARRTTLGYVSQFLRVIPRVATLELVMEPLRAVGVGLVEARERAADILTRLQVPERLWAVAPATFSGGEQQRVNIARSLAVDYPILLLDEPTASLDAENRARVIELIEAAREGGAAVVGIFHDPAVRSELATREVRFEAPEAAA